MGLLGAFDFTAWYAWSFYVAGLYLFWSAVFEKGRTHVRGVVAGLKRVRDGKATSAPSFPDVHVTITSVGHATVPHPTFPTGTVEMTFYSVRIVNRASARNAVLTFRLYVDFELDDGGPQEVVCAPFRGDHPLGKHPPPVLHMPVNVAPGTSVSGDMMFELSDWGGKSKGIAKRIEIEDHLSGARADMEPHIGSEFPPKT
jgi:hypothetical protein